MSQGEYGSQEENRDLTPKQAAILEAFDEDPGATYKEISSSASERLPEGESVSSYYTSMQIKNHRPQFFDEDDNRLDPSDISDTSDSDSSEDDVDVSQNRVSEIAEEYKVSEKRARTMARAEAQTEIDLGTPPDVERDEVQISMTEDEWLRIIGILHLFAETEYGQEYEKEVFKVAGDLATQSLGN